MTRKRYNSVDLFRFIMAVFVVAIHTHPYEDFHSAAAVDLYMFIAAMAVPFFFVACGFFLERKMVGGDESMRMAVLRQYMIRFLKLYAIGNLLYLPIVINHYVVSGMSIFKIIFDLFRGIFLTGNLYHAYVLWYLLATIYALIFIQFLERRKCSLKQIVLIGVALNFVSIFITSLVVYEGELSAPLAFFRYFLSHSIGRGAVLSAFFYIPLGMLLSKIQLSKRASLLCVCVGLLAYMLSQSNMVRQSFTMISMIGMWGG